MSCNNLDGTQAAHKYRNQWRDPVHTQIKMRVLGKEWDLFTKWLSA